MSIGDPPIKLSVLRKLPHGARIIGTEACLDMHRVSREALIVLWFDRGSLRKASFCIETGEYLGDHF